MVYGAAGVGKRVMTSSSSPGISLKQEGISYMAGAELPAVIVNVQRGGPGLGIFNLHKVIIFRQLKVEVMRLPVNRSCSLFCSRICRSSIGCF